MSAIEPFLNGLLGRCPACGEGRLFAGYLRLAARCSACGHPLGEADSGDGPAVFVILIVGFLTVFGALWSELAYNPPVWVLLAVWLPLGAALCLGALRPMKGLMVAAQIRNRSGEGRS